MECASLCWVKVYPCKTNWFIKHSIHFTTTGVAVVAVVLFAEFLIVVLSCMLLSNPHSRDDDDDDRRHVGREGGVRDTRRVHPMRIQVQGQGGYTFLLLSFFVTSCFSHPEILILKHEAQKTTGSIRNFDPDARWVFSFYLRGQNFGGQNCQKSDLLPKILSAEIFCQLKFNMLTFFSCKVYGEIRTDEKMSADKTAEIPIWC